LAAGGIALVGGGMLVWGLGGVALQCPSIDAFRAYRPPEATRVFALDGSRVADLSPERRTVVQIEDIPASVRNGFIAVEDRRFMQHGGVDMRGIGRALWRNLSAASFEEGFSTIHMQLARNVFTRELPRSSKLRRKFCEVMLAGRIDRAYSKQEILRLYLNQVYMGAGLYGVEAAAQSYFGKPVARVSLPEAALLIGLVKNPEGYNPRRNSLRAIRRRNVVLGVMAREGVVTASQAEAAQSQSLALAPPLDAAGPAPWFVAAVRQELRRMFGDDADTRGLRVHTGLDPRIQKAAREAMLKQIGRVEAGDFGRYRNAVPPPGVKLEPGDGAGSPYLQGMVLVMDAATGDVRALVGGRDFVHSSFDRVFTARRQPGSAFKPIVYAAALEAGLPAGDRIETTPVSFAAAGTAVWRPDDLVSDTVTSLPVREALALSSNYAAIRVGNFAGERRVIDVARRLGISTPIPAVPSIFLGAAEVIPAEFVAAYATLANGGTRVSPRLVTRVEDARGKVLWESQPAPDRAIDPAVAFLTVNMMEDVIDAGTGRAVRAGGFWLPAAGKTGTTNDAKDVWFVGMTPELVAGVWFGFDQPRTILPNATGGRIAAPVWANVMSAAYAKRAPPATWVPPAEGIVSERIDVASGRLATANCPEENVREEYFLAGTEPGDHCLLHPEGDVERFFKKLFRGIRKVF
jgi:penicillin-binding protein 1A